MRPSGRAPRGEGTVYEQRPGLWLAQLRIAGKRLSATGKTADEARVRLAEKVGRIADENPRPTLGIVPVPGEGPLTVGGLAALYLDACRQRVDGIADPSRRQKRLKASALVSYRNYLGAHVVKSLGDQLANEVTVEDIQVMMEAAANGANTGMEASPRTVYHAWRNGSMMYEWGVRHGLVESNPFRRMYPPPVDRTEMHITDADGLKRLLAATKGTDMAAAFALEVATGMRLGEILGLPWRCVDLKRGVIRVEQSVSIDEDWRALMTAPKTYAGRRTIALADYAAQALRERWEATPPDLRAPTALVFSDPRPGYEGRPILGRDFYYRYWRPARHAAQLHNLRFHDIRHSVATMHLEGGTDMARVSRMLGHSTVQITIDLYGHVTDAMQDQVARASERLLGDLQE